MRKNIYRLFTFLLGLIILFSLTISPACKKKKEYGVNIIVRDTTGAYVAGASVTLAPSQTPSQGNLSDQTQTGTTDGSGSASFTFKLPAILQASVSPPIPYSSGPFTGLVKLEEGKTVDKIITIK